MQSNAISALNALNVVLTDSYLSAVFKWSSIKNQNAELFYLKQEVSQISPIMFGAEPNRP